MAFLGIGAAIFGAATIGAAVVDFAVTMAVSVGLSYAAQALAGKPPAPEAAHFATQGTIQADGAVPRSFLLGTTAAAGSLVYVNTWGTSADGKSPNAYLTHVIALSDMPIKALNAVWIGGAKCTLTTDAPSSGSDNKAVMIAAWQACIAAGFIPFLSGGAEFVANYLLSHGVANGTAGILDDKGIPVLEYRKDGVDHLWIKFYDGTQTTADSFLTSKVASADRPYDANRVGTGVAYAICTALVDDTLFSSFPTYKFECEGIPLYDPTKDSTNGGTGSQRFSDTSTWGGDGDNLPAVQAYNILRGIRYGDQWMYGLQQTVQATLPAVNWNAQIAKCRDTITGASGLEPMYRSGGQVFVDSRPSDALDTLMTACQGKLSEVGGFYKIHLGAPDSPTFSFTDDDILSTEEQTFDPFLTLADSINGITGTFPDPEQAWNTASSPQYDVPEQFVRDGNRHLLANPAFDFVPYREQVQRLLKSAMAAALRERKHVITMPPVFWLVEPGDVGTWTSVRNGYDEKQFIVDGLVDRANLDVTLSLQEVDPSDYDWDHDTDYIPGTSGPTSFPRPEPQGIMDWAAEGVSILDADGYKRRPGIRLSWDGDIPGVTGIRYQVRRKDDTSAVTSGNTLELSAGAIIITQSLLPDNEYEVAGQYIPSAPRDMLWSDWISVTTPNVKFTVLDFESALRADITTLNQQVQDVANATLALITSLADNQDASDWLSRDELRTQLRAQAGALSASITHVQTVSASATAAVATDVLSLFAGNNSGSGTVNVTAQAVAGINGQLAVSYGADLDVNGYTIGWKLLNSGTGTGTTIFVTDNFQIVGTGAAPKHPFTIGTVNGSTSVGINADNVLIDASVKVRHLDVATLTAISAAFGNATVTGTLTATSGKMVVDFSNSRTLYSD